MRVFFCSRCGTNFPAKAEHCPQCGFNPYESDPYPGISPLGAGGVGWSDRIHDPRFNTYQKNRRKIILIWTVALAIVVPLMLLIFHEGRLDGESLIVAAVISGMFLLIGLYAALHTRQKGTGWDGVVEDKKEFLRERRVKESDGRYRLEPYMEYVVYIRRNDGKIEELKYTNDTTLYNYYQVGEYVHMHEDRDLRALEKYDKSRDEIIFCASCGGLMDIRADYCSQCGCPLLKGQLKQ